MESKYKAMVASHRGLPQELMMAAPSQNHCVDVDNEDMQPHLTASLGIFGETTRMSSDESVPRFVSGTGKS